MEELPFAVESPATGGARGRVGRNDGSMQHSEASSLVTASSEGSFMTSNNSNFGTSYHFDPLIPNAPQNILLPPIHHAQSQQQQGQLVVIPAPEEHSIGMKEGGYGDPENDFTYINVTEIDADEDGDAFLEGGDPNLPQDHMRGDVLAVLLGDLQQNESGSILNDSEAANEMALKASEAKKQGDLLSALDFHSLAAKLYKDIAMVVRDKNPPLAGSLLLLSQTQAKSAISLKNIVNLNPTELRQILPPSSRDSPDTNPSAAISQKERLRAVVRGALSSKHPHEADLSDSQFLGSAGNETTGKLATSKSRIQVTHNDSKVSRKNNRRDDTRNDNKGTLLTQGNDSFKNDTNNPVDEMMELERELRDVDMALELGNSISSLDVRKQNRMKSSMVGDGSFMVVAPGSSSYMSSSIWGSGHVPSTSRQNVVSSNNQQGTAGVRARANRVQNMLEASMTPSSRPLHLPPLNGNTQAYCNRNASGLESSWWGNTNTTSQILTSSVMSLTGGRTEAGHINYNSSGHSSGNTKQIMRLMDSLKTLGDENAALLREIEELESARAEAKAARETMERFKFEYGKRFANLKKALEKVRKDHHSGKYTSNGPITNSDFMKNASLLDQLQRQEQTIQKLTRDLKKEREESKKKDSALRKYENFYRDIKARSAQKAALLQTQQQRQNTKQSKNVQARTPPHR